MSVDATVAARPEPAAYPYAVASDAVAASLDVQAETGLSSPEARRRLDQHGMNEFPERPPEAFGRRLGRTIVEPMSLLLVSAAGIAGLALHETIDAIAILVIVALNTAISMVEEGRAASALASLRRLESPTATVIRDGVAQRIPAACVIPGDVLLLTAGERVAADARLLESTQLDINESLLTGESLPVRKDSGAVLDADTGLADQVNMVFAGTLVANGAGRAITSATGSTTELGRIAAALDEPHLATPLQRELAGLTTRLGVVAIAIAAVVFAISLWRRGVSGGGLEEGFLSAVALAVAAVPEGLATVTVVALALGVRRMADRGTIVRRLSAVETLGSTTVIAMDKTGTLTQNRMQMEAVGPACGVWADHRAATAELRTKLTETAALCTDATLSPPTGDPTEIALLEPYGTAEIERIRHEWRRVGAVPFDSQRRRMTTVVRSQSTIALHMKGAPEVVVPLCTRGLKPDGAIHPLGAAAREAAMAAAADAAGRGGRVLAFAYRLLDHAPEDAADEEHDLTLIGFVVLRDPIRTDAKDTVREAESAGITLLMVTGDHPGTAAAVAAEVGIADSESEAVTGADLRQHGIPQNPADVELYARVDADQKLQLIKALQEDGHVVAMTGDGVNDAPALRRADIGVALGRSGSDVARDAADMVVTDDSLATLVCAVREGRGIYANIRKVVDYLVAGNMSEICVVVGALLLFPAIGVPLLPLQLLWVNLLTDGLPAIALAVDPVDDGLMRVGPRRRSQRMLGHGHLTALVVRGCVLAAGALGALWFSLTQWGVPPERARVVLFTTLVVAHLAYAEVARRRTGLSTATPMPNPWLMAAVGVELALQAAVVMLPAAQAVFGTVALSAREWTLVVFAGLAPVGVLLATTSARFRKGW